MSSEIVIKAKELWLTLKTFLNLLSMNCSSKNYSNLEGSRIPSESMEVNFVINYYTVSIRAGQRAVRPDPVFSTRRKI